MGKSKIINMNKLNIKKYFFYTLFGVAVGLIVGVLDTLFGIGLIKISEARNKMMPIIAIFLPFAGLLILIMYKKIGKNSIKGMNLIFSVAHDVKDEEIPKRLIPLVMVGTWITHLFGGSAGREGVAVQIGATFSHTFGKYLSKYIDISSAKEKKIIISTGMAAGFAGLFGTPMAATIFALEVLAFGVVEYTALFPALIAAFTAYAVSTMLGLPHFHVDINVIPEMNVKNVALVVIAAICFSLTGMLFAILLKYFKGKAEMIFKAPLKRIFFGGILVAILVILLWNGRYSGLGTNLIDSSFGIGAGKIYYYDWILKILLTVLTLSIGFQGGEVTPLFAIGASLGFFIAGLLGLPVMFLAAIGYATVFGAATNTFLASFLIGIEIFGYKMAPFLFIACAISYIFSGEISIYSKQKKVNAKI